MPRSYREFFRFIGNAWPIVAKDGDVGGITEEAVSFVTRGLLKDAQFGKTSDKVIGGGESGAREFLNFSYRDNRTLVKGFQHPVTIAGCASQMGGNDGAVVLPESENATSSFGRLAAHIGDATKEESKPLFPVAMIPDGLEMLVVFGAVLFEKVREV